MATCRKIEQFVTEWRMAAQGPEVVRKEILALEEQALRASQMGRAEDAKRAWERILSLDPKHVRALDVLGQAAFRRGDLPQARTLLERLTKADGADAQQWVNLAVACQGLRDEAAEEAAITRALTVEPRNLLALLMRGNLMERRGKAHDAARAYGAAAAVSPPVDRLMPELRPAVTHAMQFKEKYDRDCAAFLDRHLEATLATHGAEDLRRFRDALDILVGRKRRYDSQPVILHYPRLVPIEFFDRDEFPWMDAVEAATEGIRAEYLEVLRSEQGFQPYVEYPPDVPHDQWAELNHSPRWSAFHLYKMGRRVEENASRCPKTMAVLAGVPQPRQAGRTPAAMFSLLKPRTRIPPHTGVTNVRLVVHLPLIVPPGCGFRVGNQTREWVPGKAWVFDDTIEHEAWNGSDQPRVVFIFDVWHPHLSAAERDLLGALSEGLDAFAGGAESFEL
jgi:aspartyl/asparaginyl beta-hydroxylase (cupin superfamily)